MSLEETGVLSDDIHDIRRNDGLVVLAALHLGKAQEFLDESNQESLLSFLVYENEELSRWHRRIKIGVLIAPEIEPMAQHRVFRLFQDHSEPSTCFANFSVMMFSVSTTSKWVRKTSNSLMDLYSTIVSLSFMNSRTISPSSFSTMRTYRAQFQFQYLNHVVR